VKNLKSSNTMVHVEEIRGSRHCEPRCSDPGATAVGRVERNSDGMLHAEVAGEMNLGMNRTL
jgi:hypothetical protein